MIKVLSANGYDYYKSSRFEKNDSGRKKDYYNVVTSGDFAPVGGYYNPHVICKIKNVPNLFK